MNPLRELGDRILADVTALGRQQAGLRPLDLVDDAALEESATAAEPVARRADGAAPLAAVGEASDVPSGLPVRGVFTSRYGWRLHPTLHRHKFHHGQDIAAPAGTAVAATAAGVVAFAGAAGAAGNMVEIRHGGGYRTRYAHLQAFIVRAGDVVVRGDTIGAVGSTGRSTGPHLHYAVIRDGRSVDPRPYLEARPRRRQE